MIFKKFLLLILFSCITYSQDYESITSLIHKYQNSESLKHAQWSISAKYVEDGRTIIDYNSDQSLTPASNLKLVTTFSALGILGSEYKYKTKIYYSGEIRDRELSGDLKIVGSGDPTLGSNLIKGNPSLDSLMTLIVNSVKEKGISKINGNIVLDVSKYSGLNVPARWQWEDIGNYYGAQTNTLTINDNLYLLYLKPGKNVGDLTTFLRTEPEIPKLKFENLITTGKPGSGDNGYIYNFPKSYNAVLRGTIPQGKKEFYIKGSIPEPPLFMGEYIIDKLNVIGVEVLGKPDIVNKSVGINEENLLLEIQSPPLREIVNIINKKSFNLYAEMILKEMGFYVSGEKGNFKNGLKAEEEYLESHEFDLSGVKIYDGSGLSSQTIIKTGFMTELLIKANKKSFFKDFYNSFPIAGVPSDSSSLSTWGIGTPIENNARIKTGYIGGVRSHSGYVKDKKGRLIAVSLIANNYQGRTRIISEYHKQILIALAKLK